MIEEVIRNEHRALDSSQSEQENPETLTNESDGLQKTEVNTLEHSFKLSQVQLQGCFPQLYF